MATSTTPAVRPSIPSRPPTRGLSVVVAAGRPQDAEVLALALEAVGCDVAAAAVGPEVVELAQLVQPDAVVLAPAGPGWEVLPAAIADRAGWRKPFVVAVIDTASADGVAGLHAALGRPVSPALLAGLVRRLRELLAGVDGFDPAI